MKLGTKLTQFMSILVVYVSFIGLFMHAEEPAVNFDELLETTSYAVLLKELIGLSDTIGLLRCRRMPKDERRFVEDSVLGKVIRVQDLFERTDFVCMSEDDAEYLLYWILLAKKEVLPELLEKHVSSLAHIFAEHAQRF